MTSRVLVDDPRLEELPPSAKLAYVVIASNSPCTQGEVAESAMLPQRTVRWALERLEETGVVEKRPYLEDARKSEYVLAEPGG